MVRSVTRVTAKRRLPTQPHTARSPAASAVLAHRARYINFVPRQVRGSAPSVTRTFSLPPARRETLLCRAPAALLPWRCSTTTITATAMHRRIRASHPFRSPCPKPLSVPTSKINVGRSCGAFANEALIESSAVLAQCARGQHQVTKKYGVCGIICAVLLFPCGLLCLLYVIRRNRSLSSYSLHYFFPVATFRRSATGAGRSSSKYHQCIRCLDQRCLL